MKNNETKKLLTDALIAAKKAAMEVNCEDAGSFNCDSAIFRMKGVRESTVQSAANAAGVRVYKGNHYGPCYFVGGWPSGQRCLNTERAKAAADAMKAAGLETSMYYALD